MATHMFALSAPPRPVAAWTRQPVVLCACVLLAAALLLRAGQFGNPINGLDEQYYLLVGERMWSGALPYVDLWDRKPFGLFALFAGIAAFPGNGVLAAQLAATACATGTALIVSLIARRAVGWVPAAMAGIVYLAGVNELWGETTQTPVFYNLLTAGAALLVLRAADDPLAAASRPRAIIAMLLCGLAIQIKTIAVIEGAFLGLWLVAAMWRATRDMRRTIGFAVPLMLAGAAPTLGAMLLYLLLGHFDAWWHANVVSILVKGAPYDPDAIERLQGCVLLLAPVILLALVGLRARTGRFTAWGQDTGFLLAWTAAGVLNYLAIGGFWPHYALPLLLALAPMIASALAMPRLGKPLFFAAIAWPLIHALALNPAIAASDRAAAARVVAAIPREVRERCMFIYEGPVAYYTLTGACTVTPWSFTAHLRSSREAPSLGTDPQVALRDALSKRPLVILTIGDSQWHDRYLPNDRLIAATLARDYVRIADLPNRHYGPAERLLVWRLRR